MLMSYALKRAIEKEGFKAVELRKTSKYEVGKRYWCGYWNMWYDVVAVEYDQTYTWMLKSVTVEWQDGDMGTHCTPLDINRDCELMGGRKQ